MPKRLNESDGEEDGPESDGAFVDFDSTLMWAGHKISTFESCLLFIIYVPRSESGPQLGLSRSAPDVYFAEYPCREHIPDEGEICRDIEQFFS